jgi:hypothetical protein
MESKLSELCKRAADRARSSILNAGTAGNERGGTLFFYAVEDLDELNGDVGTVSVAYFDGPKGKAVVLEALGRKVFGSSGEVKRGQEELLLEFEQKSPALLALEMQRFLTKFLKAGVSRDDVVHQLDLAVAESVMSS